MPVINIAQLKQLKVFLSSIKQWLDALNGVDSLRQLRHYCGLISAPSSDFQHRVYRAALQQSLRHLGDNIGLRNCLVVTNRQGHILIGSMGERLVKKYVPWRGADNVQHLHAANSLVDQSTQ